MTFVILGKGPGYTDSSRTFKVICSRCSEITEKWIKEPINNVKMA